MNKRELGSTGLYVSEIGFGVLPMGKTQYNLPLDVGASLIRYALSRGINFFDTAQYYETYQYICKALEPKDYSPVIISKCLYPSYSQMDQAIEEAIREMNVDYVHGFLLHEVRGAEDFDDRCGAWQCMKDAKRAGLIKAIGVSTHHVDTAFNMACQIDCDLLFPLINKDGLGIRNGDGPGTASDMAKAIELNNEAGKGVFTMKVFGGGNLTGSYMECMDYITGLTGVSSRVIGFSNRKEVDTAIAYAEGFLDRGYVPDITDKRIQVEQSDCEGCGACIKRCPNHAIFFNRAGLAQVDPKICITCGYCAPVCPVRAIIMY